MNDWNLVFSEMKDEILKRIKEKTQFTKTNDEGGNFFLLDGFKADFLLSETRLGSDISSICFGVCISNRWSGDVHFVNMMFLFPELFHDEPQRTNP